MLTKKPPDKPQGLSISSWYFYRGQLMRFMRVQKIAICTIAAITVPELTVTVNATTVAYPTTADSQQYIVEPVEAARQSPIVSFSSPESETAPQFAQTGGRGGNAQNLSSDSSLDPEQFIVVPEQQTSIINRINNLAESKTELTQTNLVSKENQGLPTRDPLTNSVSDLDLCTSCKIQAPSKIQPDHTLAKTSPQTELTAAQNSPSYIVEPQTGILNRTSVSEIQQTAIDIPVLPPENISPPKNGIQNNAQALLPVKPTTLSQANPNTTIPSPQEIQNIQNQLRNIEQNVPEFGDIYRGSPALTITNPSGFGADNNTGYIGVGYQSRVRYDDKPDGGIILGAGFGDARKSVGVEISYTLASITSDNTEFGRGGFNLKVHRQFPGDIAVAAGWNGFLNIGDNDFENSLYAVGTKVIRLQDDLRRPFSRLALTAGIGNGQFRSENDVDQDRGTVNVFGSAALRVIEPVSLIAEWTGQDLALGASIVPFKNFPFVITPAFRDITGAGDGARFVLGAGFSFQF